jgi:hypothetical protein
MPTYCQRADCLAYTENLIIQAGSEAQFDRIIEKAEKDIDHYVGDWPVDAATGLKFPVTVSLTTQQRTALRRACCAQTEYRVELGQKAFIRWEHPKVTGPDFATEGQTPWLAPKAERELAGSGLVNNWRTVKPATA